jgi:molybdenum cofactor guanylyltransferase
MAWRQPSSVSGYVLAGGQSSRMGSDKALLELAGKPLALHAVVKLRRVCDQVFILGSNPELDDYAPLVRDVHPDCGPIGGIEAALLHSPHDWIVTLPVDVPFLPTAFLDWWIRSTLQAERRGARVSFFTVDGVPQPALLMAHIDVLPFISNAIERGDYKLFPVLLNAAMHLADHLGLPLSSAFRNFPWLPHNTFGGMQGHHDGEDWWTVTDTQQHAKSLWFANLNTPEDFAMAEQHTDALDT